MFTYYWDAAGFDVIVGMQQDLTYYWDAAGSDVIIGVQQDLTSHRKNAHGTRRLPFC